MQYVNDHVPKDKFSREIEAEIVRLRYDKEVRREFMVLSTRLKDAQMTTKIEIAVDTLRDEMSIALLACYSKLTIDQKKLYDIFYCG